MTQLLTLKEVQKRLQIGRTTLRYLIDEDTDFVTVKLGYRRLMSEDALDAFIRAKEGQRPQANAKS